MMEIQTLEDYSLEFRKVFGPVHFVSESGEKLTIVMRDSGFELHYNGINYEAKGGRPMRPLGLTNRKTFIDEIIKDVREEHDIEQEYEIWMEGYRATGEYGTAQMIGSGRGKTFDDAVRDYKKKNPDSKVEQATDFGGSKFWHIWACRLFDNEKDARKSYG